MREHDNRGASTDLQIGLKEAGVQSSYSAVVHIEIAVTLIGTCCFCVQKHVVQCVVSGKVCGKVHFLIAEFVFKKLGMKMVQKNLAPVLLQGWQGR